MASNRGLTIAISVDWIAGAYARLLLAALLRSIERIGGNALCFDHGVRVWDLLGSRRIDAIVLCVLGESRNRPELMLGERLPNVPKVAIGHAWGDAPLIQADNNGAMWRAVHHLHHVHGRRRFAYIGGPTWHDEALSREHAFRHALDECGLTLEDELVGYGDFEFDSARQLVRDWLRFGLEFDALVAANDQMARGAMDALGTGRVRVPRDVSVTGFDNVDEAELTNPPLTTLRQDLQAQADRAIELLVAQTEGRPVQPVSLLPCDLVVRRSCGCLYYGEARTPTLAPGPRPSRPPQGEFELELTRIAAPRARKPEEWAESLSEELTQASTRGGGELVDALDSAREHFGGGSTQWGNAINMLLRRLDAREKDLLELWRSAGSWLGHLKGLEQGAQRVAMEHMAVELAAFGEHTTGAPSRDALARVVSEHLANFQFPSAYIVLFDDPDLRVLGSSRVLLAHRNGERDDLERGAFATLDILPEAFAEELGRRHFMVETLGLKDRVFGFLLLEIGPPPGLVYTLVRQSISSSLESIRLYEQLLEEERRREAADRQRMERELQIAAAIQTSILPLDPRAAGMEIAAVMLPASEVGGDYYDVLETAGGAWFGIGDVAGHGLTTGLVMLMIRSIVASLVEKCPDARPSELLTTLNPVLYSSVRTRLKRDEHATLTLLRYEASGKITFAGAHEELLVWRAATGKIELIPTPGTWVGATAEIGDGLVDSELLLSKGDLLVLYTDGAIEGTNADGEQYGLERLMAGLERRTDLPAGEICLGLLDDVTDFMQQQHDDVTLVVLRYEGV
jgi:serine phosphatase RsbU (regulator of sigma subunit)/DNA-binding LacI/PurR family transcriptional regulator